VSYHAYEPIDPRDAFTVTAREDEESTQSAAASQAALLLAIRSGVLGDTPTNEKLREFPLPDTRKLRRTRHLKVADACSMLGASEKELRQDGEPLKLLRRCSRPRCSAHTRSSLSQALPVRARQRACGRESARR
jgi:hypothetical protein